MRIKKSIAIDNLDASNIKRTQAIAVNILLSFIKRQRNTSFYRLVHSFCRIYLPYGYEFKTFCLNREEVVITDSSSTSQERRHRSKSLGGVSDKKSPNFISSKIDTIFFKNNKTRAK